MAYQGHTPAALLNLVRHLPPGEPRFFRSAHGNPWFEYAGRRIAYRKHNGFRIIESTSQRQHQVRDFWAALDMMRRPIDD